MDTEKDVPRARLLYDRAMGRVATERVTDPAHAVTIRLTRLVELRALTATIEREVNDITRLRHYLLGDIMRDTGIPTESIDAWMALDHGKERV